MNYILTVALHAFALSAFAALVVLFIRQPQHRATATLLVLIAITFLPWILF